MVLLNMMHGTYDVTSGLVTLIYSFFKSRFVSSSKVGTIFRILNVNVYIS